MDIGLIVARAVHFAGAISLAGLFGFVAFIARPAYAGEGGILPARLRRHFAVLGWISLGATLLVAPVWLLFVAQNMSGASFGETVARGIGVIVLTQTQFGHAFVLRIVLTLALLPFVTMIGRRAATDAMAAVLATVSLAGIAWQGHAGSDTAWKAPLHLAADASHLVAAGLWLGALLPLAALLGERASARIHQKAATRFSDLGVACVGVLLATGLVNSWLLVGSLPRLIGTPYGQTLLAKLVLVATILCLAGINRWRLVPRLLDVHEDDDAARRIARHATIEAALGLGIIVIVGALGIMIPAVHQQLL